MRSLWLAAALVPMLAVPAMGQVKVEVKTPGVVADVKASKVALRASKVVGMAVKNAKSEDLGKIEDLVMDESGQVRYAAISFGGFLGFNNKLFAVPYSALRVKHDQSSNSYFVELNNVSKEHLERANGFPSDNWPNFNDVETTKKIDAIWVKTEGTLPATTLPRDK